MFSSVQSKLNHFQARALGLALAASLSIMASGAPPASAASPAVGSGSTQIAQTKPCAPYIDSPWYGRRMSQNPWNFGRSRADC